MCSIHSRLPEQEPDWIPGPPDCILWGLLAFAMLIFVAVALLTPATHAQQGGGQKPTQLPYVTQTRPIAIPSTPTDVIRQDCYVCYADLAGTGQVITITDRQGAPITWLVNTLGASGSRSTWFFLAPNNESCRWMPGGVTWGADSTGATGYLTLKCPTGPCSLQTGQ